MPVNLPLPPPPEPAPPAIQQAQQDAGLDLQVDGVGIRVYAPADMRAADLQRGLTGSRDAIDALRRLPYLAIAAGHLSIRTYYLREDDGSLKVWLLPQPVVAVSGDQTLREYFEDLAQPPAELSPARLEPARTLAGLHARRAGLSSTPKLLPEGEGLRLDIPAKADGHRGDVRVSYGNPGNRYVGRRFVDLEASLASRGGTELGLFLRESDRLFQGGQTDYHEQSLTLSQYHPLGLFSLGGRHFDYRIRETGQPILDGAQDQVELSWLAIPRADFRARWTTELKLDYIDQSVRQNSDDALLRSERYPSLSATVQRTATTTLFEYRLDYDLSLLLRQGLGKTDSDGSGSDLDYRYGRAGFGLRWRLASELAIEAQLAGQWSDDRLPDAQLWTLGGSQFMRAWFPGVALGDRGAYGRLSALHPREPDGNWQFTPAAHLEWGRSDRDDSPDAQLADAALSVDFRYGKYWSGSLGSALPISEHTDPRLRDGARAGFFFRLTADF